MSQLEHNYGHLIRILHWSNCHVLHEALEEMELTPSQGGILGFLSFQKQPPCPKDIEAAFHLSHPTVSGLLSRLEQKGFLELRPDPKDRRSKRIYSLPKGIACQDRMHSIIAHNEEQIVHDFTPDEQAQFIDLLLRAIQNMGEEVRPPEFKEESNP